VRAPQTFSATAPGGVRLLAVEVAPLGDLVTVRATGEVDAFTGRTLEAALTAAAAMVPARLVVDLTAVSYFSASSVALLHRARRQVAAPEVLEVVTAPGIVERVVTLLGRPVVAA